MIIPEIEMARPRAGLPVVVGARARVWRTFTSLDVDTFAKLVGDNNAIHRESPEARAGRFGRPVVHGALLASLWSTLLGCWLPGPGTIYKRQSTRFKAPVFVGEGVTATVEVTEIRTDKPEVTLRCEIHDRQDVLVAEGEAVVLYEGPQ